MFGDDNYYEDLADKILEAYTFDLVLELSDLTEAEALARLIELGLINTDDFVQS